MALTEDLAGRVAVITGGGSGLGAAMGRAFAEVGMGVAVLDIDEASATQVAASLADECGVPTMAARVDVGDRSSITAAAERVRATFGGCDVMCANVGVQQFGAIDRLTDDDWRFVLDVNVLGTVRTVRAFLPLLRARSGWRRIVLTASSSVLAPGVRMAAYQTTKFAVMGFGETLREELADEGIGVTVLFPGGMITSHLDSSARARPAELASTGAQDDDLTAMLTHRPMADGDVVMPEYAIRNLLTDLLANEPYSPDPRQPPSRLPRTARRHGRRLRPNGVVLTAGDATAGGPSACWPGHGGGGAAAAGRRCVRAASGVGNHHSSRARPKRSVSTDFTWLNSCRPSGPCTRPMPDSFTPPKGSAGTPYETITSLMQTLPASRPAVARRSACAASADHTDELRP